MDNSTVNFSTPETSTNSTTCYLEIISSLNICVFSIVFIFGLPTHCCVLWLIFTSAEGRVVLAFFNINLSVCEIGICLNSLIYAMSYCFLSFSTFKMFFFGLSITGRPLFQCLMCVERYLAVVHPVTFLKYKPLRYRLICCAAVWIITLGSCVFCLYTYNYKDNSLYLWFISTQYLLFFSIQLFCLVAVLRALKQSGPGERKRGMEENHMKRRAFQIILITTGSIAVTYGPYTIIGFVTIVVNKIIDPIWLFGFACSVLAGFVNPVLYFHSTRKLTCPCLKYF